MVAETIEIPVSTFPVYEAAALFVSALAYPEDKNRRDRFQIAYCKEWIRLKACYDTEYARTETIMRPEYILMNDISSKAEMVYGRRKLKDRKMAAVIQT